MNNIEDNKYNAKLLEDINSIKTALQYYMTRNADYSVEQLEEKFKKED